MGDFRKKEGNTCHTMGLYVASEKNPITRGLQKKNGLPPTQTCVMVFLKLTYRAFSYDVTAAMLVSKNNKAAAVLCSKPALWV